MTIEQLRARLAELRDQANGIQARCEAANRDMTEDEATELNQILADFDTAFADLGNMERIASMNTRLEASAGRVAAPTGTEGDGDAAGSALPISGMGAVRSPYSDRGKWGWSNFGEFAAAARQAQLNPGQIDSRFTNAPTTSSTEGVGADGGFAVPPDYRTEIMQAVEGEDSLMALTDPIPTSSNSITIPKDETTPWGTSGVQAYWDGEGDTLAQSKVALGQDNIRLNKLTALVPVTDELLEDAPALGGYIQSRVPEVMTSKINLAMLQGSGVGQPLGVLNGGDLVSVAKESGQAADTILHHNIVNMFARMYAPSRRKAVWVINQDIEPQLNLMAFQNTAAGGPIYMPPNGLAGSPLATLMGRPILPLEACETLGDKGDIVLCDWSKYLTAIKAGGVKSDVSIHLYFDTAHTAFRFIMRIAGQPAFSAPITKRDGANTLARFVTLDERA
jgi:HK97 family phage major capsid protein